MSDKICIWCKQDCSQKPRQKDAKGRYLCQECVKPYLDAMKSKPQSSKSASVEQQADQGIPLEPVQASGGGGGMGELLEQQVAKVSQSCESCGRPMAKDAIICTHCGYNTESGRQLRSRVVEQKQRSATSEKAGKAASAVANSAPVALLLGGVGALVGGAIGAAAWAFVAYQFQLEIGYLALGVGALCGAGAAMGARGYSGLLTGLAAVVVSIVSILVGKYIVVSYIIDEELGDQLKITQHDYIVAVADDIVLAREANGETIDWPPGMTFEFAYEAEDYPPEIWEEAQTTWSQMSASERAQLQREVETAHQIGMETLKGIGVLASFGFLDIVFFLLAIMAAFGVGSGGSFE